jgi:hypothetical protein
MVMGGYWTRPDWLAVSSRLAKLTKSQDMMVTTPTFGSPEHAALDDVPTHGPPPTPPRPAQLTALYPAGPA